MFIWISDGFPDFFDTRILFVSTDRTNVDALAAIDADTVTKTTVHESGNDGIFTAIYKINRANRLYFVTNTGAASTTNTLVRVAYY